MEEVMTPEELIESTELANEITEIVKHAITKAEDERIHRIISDDAFIVSELAKSISDEECVAGMISSELETYGEIDTTSAEITHCEWKLMYGFGMLVKRLSDNDLRREAVMPYLLTVWRGAVRLHGATQRYKTYQPERTVELSAMGNESSMLRAALMGSPLEAAAAITVQLGYEMKDVFLQYVALA